MDQQPPHTSTVQQLRATVASQQVNTISALEAELEKMKTAKADLEAQVNACSNELLEEKVRAAKLEGPGVEEVPGEPVRPILG